MRFSFRRFAAWALAATVFVGPAATASAAVAQDSDDEVTWMVRPSDGVGEDGRSWVELELAPGESVQEHLLVRNLSPSPITFRLTGADGYFTDKGRFTMLTSDRESVDAGTWIDIPDTVTVPSGGDSIVPFRVRVPRDATPGDHPAGVAASIRSAGENEVGVESRVGFRVMTRVVGDLAPAVQAEVSGGYGGTANPFQPGTIEVAYAVTNSGNTRLSITPRIQIGALFGVVSFTGNGPAIEEIAPGETRNGTLSFGSTWPMFVYSAQVDVTGEVVDTAAAAAPRASVSASARSSVIAMPWAQLVALTIAAVLLWLLRRERRRQDGRNTNVLTLLNRTGNQES